MRKLLAPLLVGLMTLGTPFTPPASALDHVTWECEFLTVSNEVVTGGQNTYTGVIYGYAVSSNPSDSVELICYIRVDGDPSSPPAQGTECSDGPGMGGDTYGPCQVTYTATDTQTVEICGVVYVNGSLHDHDCFPTTTTQIPPQAVLDAIDSLFDLIADLTAPLDPIICGVIKTLGLPALVNSASSITGIYVDPDDCDVWLIREVLPPPLPTIFPCPTRIVDFVPYNDPYGGPGCVTP